MENNIDDNNNTLDIQIENSEAKPANKKLTILNFIIIAVIFIGLGIYMVTVDGIDNIVNLLKSVDYKWVFRWNNMSNFILDL